MKYKMIITDTKKTYVKSISKSKDHLLKWAMSLSKKHPKWKITIVKNESLL